MTLITWTASSVAAFSERARVFAVGDMTGDGLPARYDQDAGVVTWWTSQSNYTLVGGTVTVGTSLAYFL